MMKSFKAVSVIVFLISCLIVFFAWQDQQKETLLITEFESIAVSEEVNAILDSIIEPNSNVKHIENSKVHLENAINKAVQPQTENKDDKKFWIVVAFSGVFSLSALFVVLSGKYDENTKKWAFGIISTIASFWLGSVVM